MTLRLNGSTSGYTEIDAPAVAGSNTLILPGGNGSADQALVTNGSGTLSWADRGRMVLDTSKTATGTSVDFTGIPSWVKRVTVMFSGVSTNGTSNPLIQIGSGSIFTTGYVAQSSLIYGTNLVTVAAFTSGFGVFSNQAADVMWGTVVLNLVGSNVWIASGVVGIEGRTGTSFTTGAETLSGTLDRVRITTVNGTDAFDAGSINILYEG